MGSAGCEDGAIDKFPIGMRVLAVDDDPTCLKVLENFLRACQYEGLLLFLLCLFFFTEFCKTRGFSDGCLLNI